MLIEYFVQTVGKKNSIICSINLKSIKLSEFSYYLHDYGSIFNGKMAKGPFPGKWDVSLKLHLTGPFSFSFYKMGIEVPMGDLGIEQFVNLCCSEGERLLAENRNAGELLERHCREDIGQDQRVAILLFGNRLAEARKLIEDYREPDGVVFRSYMNHADAYLRDIGH
jgi:hypothetical protein